MVKIMNMDIDESRPALADHTNLSYTLAYRVPPVVQQMGIGYEHPFACKRNKADKWVGMDDGIYFEAYCLDF